MKRSLFEESLDMPAKQSKLDIAQGKKLPTISWASVLVGLLSLIDLYLGSPLQFNLTNGESIQLILGGFAGAAFDLRSKRQS